MPKMGLIICEIVFEIMAFHENCEHYTFTYRVPQEVYSSKFSRIQKWSSVMT